MYGLLGFPNVGKSSFLSRVTSATPKIADYHFTTLTPNLGVAKTEFGESFVIADIPGIIEGASKGVGLGLQFLRHIERTRLLLHFVDVSGTEEREPVEDFYTIQNELKAYNEKLSERKQIIVASKSDIIQDITLYEELEKLANKENMKLFKISTVTGEGINELMEYICKILKEIPKEEINPVEERVIYTLEKEENDFEIQVKGNEYIVSGSAVDRIMRRVNIQDRESMHYLQKKLEEVRYFWWTKKVKS